MKFLVDAHLPPGLCTVLEGARQDAIHTRQLAGQNRTLDGVINELSMREERVVVTKDTDFYRPQRDSNKRGHTEPSKCFVVGGRERIQSGAAASTLPGKTRA